MWSDININSLSDKGLIAGEVRKQLAEDGYKVIEEDIARPWGGYFRIDEKQGEKFREQFFKEITLPDWAKGLNFSPKILITAPGKRLSWQYHHRRGEVWKMVKGDAGVYLSSTDEQPAEPKIVKEGRVIDLPAGTRHRHCGLDTWVIWAEMWMHVDPDNPSTEEDNVRVADDYGRS